jgi:hypothetical protein
MISVLATNFVNFILIMAQRKKQAEPLSPLPPRQIGIHKFSRFVWPLIPFFHRLPSANIGPHSTRPSPPTPNPQIKGVPAPCHNRPRYLNGVGFSSLLHSLVVISGMARLDSEVGVWYGDNRATLTCWRRGRSFLYSFYAAPSGIFCATCSAGRVWRLPFYLHSKFTINLHSRNLPSRFHSQSLHTWFNLERCHRRTSRSELFL